MGLKLVSFSLFWIEEFEFLSVLSVSSSWSCNNINRYG